MSDARPNPPSMQTLGSNRSRGAAGDLRAGDGAAETMRSSAAANPVKVMVSVPDHTSAGGGVLLGMPCIERSTLAGATAKELVRPKSRPFDAELAAQRPRLTLATGVGDPERPASPLVHDNPVPDTGLGGPSTWQFAAFAMVAAGFVSRISRAWSRVRDRRLGERPTIRSQQQARTTFTIGKAHLLLLLLTWRAGAGSAPSQY